MLSENKSKTLSVRLSQKDYDYIQVIAYMGGMTPSKLVRSICDASINALKLQIEKGVVKDEDIQAILHHKL